jgi:hypothetical protein
LGGSHARDLENSIKKYMNISHIIWRSKPQTGNSAKSHYEFSKAEKLGVSNRFFNIKVTKLPILASQCIDNYDVLAIGGGSDSETTDEEPVFAVESSNNEPV